MKLIFLILSSTLLSCSSIPLKEIDRSRLNSKVMKNENFSSLNSLSPHTSLRNSQASSAGCSVCAH